MKKIFISHPYIDNPEENKIKIDKICKYICEYNSDILPISPLHLFSFIDKETPDLRENILDICYKLIENCDEVYIYGNSNGCQLEKQKAIELGKPYHELDPNRL